MSLIGISIFGTYTHTLATSLCVYYFLIRESFFYIASLFLFNGSPDRNINRLYCQ
jgi:uncharacterized membrane protein